MLLCFQEASGTWVIRRQQSQGLLGGLAAPSGTLLTAHMMSKYLVFRKFEYIFCAFVELTQMAFKLNVNVQSPISHLMSNLYF